MTDRKWGPRSLCVQNEAAIRELAETDTCTSIAEKLDISYTEVARFCRHRGITPGSGYTVTDKVLEARKQRIIRDSLNRLRQSEGPEDTVENILTELKSCHKDNILCKKWVNL